MAEVRTSDAGGTLWLDGKMIGSVTDVRWKVSVPVPRRWWQVWKIGKRESAFLRKTDVGAGSSSPYRSIDVVRTGTMKIGHIDTVWTKKMLAYFGIKPPPSPWWARAIAWMIAGRMVLRRGR
jgi:hypothetical protein